MMEILTKMTFWWFYCNGDVLKDIVQVRFPVSHLCWSYFQIVFFQFPFRPCLQLPCFSSSLSRVWLEMPCFSSSLSRAPLKMPCFPVPFLGRDRKCCVFPIPFLQRVRSAVFFQVPFSFPVPFQFPSSSLPSSLRGFPMFFQGKCVADFFKEKTKMFSFLKTGKTRHFQWRPGQELEKHRFSTTS